MGVPRFFGVVVRKHFAASLLLKLPQSGVDWLHLDLNAMFHPEAAEVYNYGDVRKTRTDAQNAQRDAQILKTSDEQLTAMLFERIFQTILKLTKQANPRKGIVLAVDGLAPLAKLNQQRGRRLKAALSRVGTQSRFDGSSQFTPGTIVMFNLDTYIRDQIIRRRSEFPPTVEYYSHLTHGEGEHKLLQHIRGLPTSDIVAVVGMDADLIMLTLTLNHQVYIIRENLDPSTYWNRETNRREPDAKVIDIPKFRRAITAHGTSPQDFVLAFFLYGNDFLPGQAGLTEVSDSFPAMWEILPRYKLTNPDGTIDFVQWFTFVAALEPLQLQLVAAIAQRPVKWPFTMAQKALVNGVIDPQQFKTDWYARALYANVIPYTNEQFTAGIEDFKNYYLTTLVWVKQYYAGHRTVDWNFAFPRLYAPLLGEVALTAQVYDISPKPYQLGVIGQMISVLPLYSRALVPTDAQAAYDPTSPISDMYPVGLQTVYDGKTEKEEYLGVPLIPPIDIVRVAEVERRLPMSQVARSKYNEAAPYVNAQQAPTVKGVVAKPLPRLPAPNVRQPQVAAVAASPAAAGEAATAAAKATVGPASTSATAATAALAALTLATPTQESAYYADANLRTMYQLYGYDVTRQVFPPTRRFYPDLEQLPKDSTGGGVLTTGEPWLIKPVVRR